MQLFGRGKPHRGRWNLPRASITHLFRDIAARSSREGRCTDRAGLEHLGRSSFCGGGKLDLKTRRPGSAHGRSTAITGSSRSTPGIISRHDGRSRRQHHHGHEAPRWKPGRRHGGPQFPVASSSPRSNASPEARDPQPAGKSRFRHSRGLRRRRRLGISMADLHRTSQPCVSGEIRVPLLAIPAMPMSEPRSSRAGGHGTGRQCDHHLGIGMPEGIAAAVATEERILDLMALLPPSPASSVGIRRRASGPRRTPAPSRPTEPVRFLRRRRPDIAFLGWPRRTRAPARAAIRPRLAGAGGFINISRERRQGGLCRNPYRRDLQSPSPMVS